MSKFKKIGIPIWSNLDSQMIGITKPYYSFIIEQLECIPKLINWSNKEVEDIDLLLLPGGPDIDSQRYGEIPSIYNTRPCPQREYFDKEVLPLYITSGIPIFGICRGEQSLAVSFGAKLIQHLPYHSYSDKSRDQEVHSVVVPLRLIKDSKINKPIAGERTFKILEPFTTEKAKYKVNSLHHQCVDRRNHGLMEPFLFSNPDTHVEGMFHKELPIIAIQWHPEEMIYDVLSLNLIRYLLDTKQALGKV
jgi:putative glutamine amidotransferase